MKRFLKPIMATILCAPLVAFANIPGGLKTVGQGEAFYLGVIKVYDAQLSVSANASRTTVLDASVSRCLKLDYAVELTADKFALAADTILKRQHDAATLARFQPQISQWHDAYQDVQPGDVYRMCYDASTQMTSLLLNGKAGTNVKSAEFASLYFGIWLGEKQPIAQSLRSNLLRGL